MKKILSVLLSVAVVATLLVGCGGSTETKTDDSAAVTTTDSTDSATTDAAPAAEATGKKVGVSMPTKDLQRWNQDGANMEKELKAAGYEVELQYAANDVATQLNQVNSMVANGCDVIVIAAIEGSSLGEALDMAKAAGIPVIAYDRLLMNSDAVSYYATFDNYMVGTKQGEYIEQALDLANADGPFNMEITAGTSSIVIIPSLLLSL